MQISTLFTLLLSAGALPTILALPADTTDLIFSVSEPVNETDIIPDVETEDGAVLLKRSNYGWLSSYAPTDYTCKGKHAKYRPKIHTGSCIKFRPESDNVGISWGSWPIGVSGLDIFSDDNCKVYAGKTIKAPDFASKEGPGTCVSVRSRGAKWGSVRQELD